MRTYTPHGAIFSEAYTHLSKKGLISICSTYGCLSTPSLKYEFMLLKITLRMGDFLMVKKIRSLVRMKGLEPSRREAHAPKACVSTNSTTSA